MKTSATEPTDTLLVFLDEQGRPARRLAVGGVEPRQTVLAVPGAQAAIHWLELPEGLTQAQAAAAARLALAGASAEPISEMHVAIGRPEAGLTPAALVPAERMAAWIAAAEAQRLDPDLIVPTPLLLAPPATGFVRRDAGSVSDYRGPAAAFSLEPEIAASLVEDKQVGTITEEDFEAGLPPLLAAPPLDLRQGPFERRRRWSGERPQLRRIAVLALLLALVSLAVQVATILGFTFAADRLHAEAEALAAEGSAGGPGFAATAAALFEAIRATPNVEIGRIDYRPDGSLTAVVTMDSHASFAALQARLEAAGLSVEPGERRTAGGRPTADLTVRPA